MARGNHLAALAVLALLALSGCGDGGAGAAIAQVGREAITRSTLDHWVAVETDLEGAAYVDRRAILGRLIALRWVLAEAVEHGLRVSSAEARKQLDLLSYARRSHAALSLFPGETELQQLLKSSKLTAADRVWLVSLQMLAVRLRQQLAAQAEGEIGRQRIASFYRDNRRSFVVPEKRDVEAFMTNDWATAARGKREIQAGKNFQTVAKRLNISFEAHDGLIMGLARGAGEAALEKHLFGAKPHVLLGPVKQVLTYVFRVTKIMPQHFQPLAQVEASIRKKLAAGDAANVLLPALQQRWHARTACSSGHVVAQCREYASVAGKP
jgi:foldase protein PrsA